MHSLVLFDFEHVQRSVFVSCWKYILQYIVFAVKSREALQNVRNTENICWLQKSFAFELDFLLRTFLQCWCATVKNEEWPFQKGHSILSWFWQISWQENPLKVTNSFFLTKTKYFLRWQLTPELGRPKPLLESLFLSSFKFVWYSKKVSGGNWVFNLAVWNFSWNFYFNLNLIFK